MPNVCVRSADNYLAPENHAQKVVTVLGQRGKQHALRYGGGGGKKEKRKIIIAYPSHESSLKKIKHMSIKLAPFVIALINR